MSMSISMSMCVFEYIYIYINGEDNAGAGDSGGTKSRDSKYKCTEMIYVHNDKIFTHVMRNS